VQASAPVDGMGSQKMQISAPAAGPACPRRSCWSDATAFSRAAVRAEPRQQALGAARGGLRQAVLIPAVVAVAEGQRDPRRPVAFLVVVVVVAEEHRAPRRPAASPAVGEVEEEGAPPCPGELGQLWRVEAAAAVARPLPLCLEVAGVVLVEVPLALPQAFPLLQALQPHRSQRLTHHLSMLGEVRLQTSRMCRLPKARSLLNLLDPSKTQTMVDRVLSVYTGPQNSWR
jgi:hypothetical protein